jgi:putative adenylate-forming enzyme
MSRLAILWHYTRARQRTVAWPDRAALERWQEARVRRHLQAIASRSPYFGRLARRTDVTLWRHWPTSDKALMMGHFDEWNTAGVRLEDAWPLAVEAERTRDFSRTLNGLTVGFSSGTSGSRGLFLASASERGLWAGMLLARVLRGTLLHRHRAALFLRADSPLYRTLGSRRFQFEFFDLLQPLDHHRRRLSELRPTVLAAPPGVLTRLAAWPEAERLLAPPGILVSVADVLDAADRARTEEAFGCPVGQIYQATEGFLAATCPEGRLHWNEDAVVIEKEWLGGDGRESDGSRGEGRRYTPIITDFRRLTQPIVRYRLDDVIVADDGTPCPCGSPFETFGEIEGRHDDALRLPRADGAGEVLVFPDFVRRAVAMGVPPGIDYTVRQTSSSRWSIALSEPCAMAPIEREVKELARRLGAVAPDLATAPWEPPALHAKRRRVRCELPPGSVS